MTAKVLTRASSRGIFEGPEATGASAPAWAAFSAMTYIIAPGRQKTQTALRQELSDHRSDGTVPLDEAVPRLGHAEEVVERVRDRVEAQVVARGKDIGQIRARYSAGEVKGSPDRLDLLGVHREVRFRKR